MKRNGRTVHVYSSDELSVDDPRLRRKILLGVFWWLIVILFAIALAYVYYYRDAIDQVSQFWVAFISVVTVLAPFVYQRFKKMVRP